MRAAFSMVVIALAPFTAAEKTPAPLQLLASTAHKYADIGSYEAKAMASHPVGKGVMMRWELTFAYASPKMTPADSPVPMIPQVVSMRPLGYFDQHNRSVKDVTTRAEYGPSSEPLQFERIAWRVTRAKIAGRETVNGHQCEIVDAQYEGANQNPDGKPVRYWIEQSTATIWKIQFSQTMSKSDDIARWTIVWDSWTENHAAPVWLVKASGMFVGKERTELIGRRAPEIVGQSPSGERFQLANFKGRIVVLDFWATWCGPCAEEMASLERLKKTMASSDVEIWSITEDDPDAVKLWLNERGRTLPATIVPKDTAFRSYGVDSLPQIAIIDRNGIVAHQWAGLKSEKDLRDAISALQVSQ